MRTLTLLALMLPVAALAQSSEEEEPKAPRNVRYAEVTEIDMAGADLTATVQKPQGSIVIARKQAVFPPLIDLRVDFDAELAESVRRVK